MPKGAVKVDGSAFGWFFGFRARALLGMKGMASEAGSSCDGSCRLQRGFVA